MADLRQRMDAIFLTADTANPWQALPDSYGKPDTVSRFFRRLTHAGLWQRLLEALTDLAPSHPLRGIESFIFRACRRAYRILGLRFITLIRRLRMHSALPGPPWLVPDPILSERLRSAPFPDRPTKSYLVELRHLLRIAGGRAYLPRWMRLAWS